MCLGSKTFLTGVLNNHIFPHFASDGINDPMSNSTQPNLMRRALQIMTQHRLLWILGVLVAFVSSGSFGARWVESRVYGTPLIENPLAALTEQAPAPGEVPPIPLDEDTAIEIAGAVASEAGATRTAIAVLVIVGAVLLVAFVMLVIAAALWLLLTGMIIRYAEDVLTGTGTTLSTAFNAGLKSTWRLLLVASIPPVPLLISLLIAAIIGGWHLIANVPRGNIDVFMEVVKGSTGLWTTLSVLQIPFVLIFVVLFIVQIGAFRAAVLEDARVMSAFRKGWAVMRDHTGTILAFLLVQIAAGLVVTMLVGVLSGLPVIGFVAGITGLLLHGLTRGYFIVLWSTAWHHWAKDAAL